MQWKAAMVHKIQVSKIWYFWESTCFNRPWTLWTYLSINMSFLFKYLWWLCCNSISIRLFITPECHARRVAPQAPGRSIIPCCKCSRSLCYKLAILRLIATRVTGMRKYVWNVWDLNPAFVYGFRPNAFVLVLYTCHCLNIQLTLSHSLSVHSNTLTSIVST